MAEKDVMQWVTMLPEVGGVILRNHEEIVGLAREADELEKQASEKRAEAYRAGLALTARVRELWSDEDITAARKLASVGVTG